MDKDITAAASRRDLLRAGLAVLAAGGVISVAGQARADDKLDQATVQYQTTPNAGAQCSNCVNFLPNKDKPGNNDDVNGCKLYPGDTEIPPHGYCSGFVAKPPAAK